MAYRQQNKHSNPTDFRLNTLAACIKTAVTGGMLMSFAAPVCAELPVPSAVWASMGGAIASVNPAGTAMHIEQQTDRVILNWDKFNVSAGSSVNFQQPSSSSIALNKIHQADPSQILGTVSANGQLYLVNNNGFVFGKDSQVNARGLVASTLDISEETLQAGITKRSGIDQQAALEGNGDFYQRDGNGNFKLDADGNKIPVKILTEAGAKISSTEGGRILIIAPSIENRGDVSSAGGQVVMAAATDKVYLQEAPLPSEDPNADPVANSDVRGLLVEVKTGGKVENLGNVSADRGNVTLVGFAVNQNGRVSATTATNVNGTIRLLARENGAAQLIAGKTQLIPGSTTRVADNGDGLGTSARVSFGENSKTEILPEVEYGVETRTVQGSAPVEVVVEKTAIDAQPQPQSRIEAVGHKVHVKSGANITAPGGKVELTATRAPANPVADNSAVNDSRVLIDAGARIDVSGIDTVTRSMESNVIEVELRNFELKDAPLQKDGVLKNEKVSIDIRQGSPLTDIGPTVAGIKRTIAERLTEGGDIVLRSEGDVIVEKGAVLDVSGGFITYLDGYINTSKLISNGRLIDIGVADPLRRYEGIYGQYSDSSEKWGAAATRTWYASGPFSLGRFERGYVEGKNAGSLTIRANQVVLEGQLLAKAVNGRYQREIADQARGGILNINTRFNDNNVQSVEFTTTPAQPLNLGIDDVLPGGYGNVLAFQAGSLLSGGFSDVSFNSNGKITVNRNVELRLADGGSVSAANGSVEHVGGSLRLVGGQIDIQGRISGAGARVDLNTVLVTPAANVSGDIVIGPAAVVDLQGNWVNDFVTPANLDGKSIAIEGGKFSATMAGASGGSLLLQQGSVIDVSGGAQVRADRTLRAGKAGSVTLVAKPEVENVGGNIELRGLINGYGIGQGGRFVLVANSVRVRREEELDNSPGIKPLQLTADFFGRGGFADYEIGANLNGLSVESGAVINLSQSNRILNNSFLQQANAAGIAGFSRVGRLAEQFRAAGSLKLSSDHSAGSNPAANLTLAQGAAIVADPLSKIELFSDSGLIVDGRIQAAGGSVQLSIIPDQSNLDPQYQAKQGIWLGANARINVAGSARVMTDALGRRYGEVFDGGSVIIDAQRGFFASQAGSLINVSGTQAVLDVPVMNPGGVGATYRATQIGSNAGNIDITTAEGAFMAGSMQARAGAAPGAAGGSLSLILNSDNRSDPEPLSSSFPAAARTILITQQQQTVLSGGFAQPGDALPQAQNGKAYLSVDQIKAGGFASLALATQGVNGDNNVLYDNGEIRFVGDIQLNLANRIALDSVKLGWQRQNAGDSGLVSLSAASVALGSDLQRQPSWQPTAGDGHLKVNAKLIDLIGGMTTLGFNRVDLTAANDIRLKGIRVDSNELDFVGQFKTFSQLNLTAAQVYPTSLTDFTLAVAGDPDGSVTIAHSGAKAGQVYSAMGKLNISAPNIQQNGTLLAPLGEINLQAGKNINFGGQSLTSVSAAGKIIPLGVTQGGLEWMLPLAGTGGNMNVVNPDIKPADFDKKFIFESPRKKITVSADKIQREEGALVDLSGGGDLLAYEFIPGDGGTLDVLDSNGVFAILPGFNGYAPYDPSTFPASGLQIGERIYLSAGSGVAAGFYTLLPARYALLRGAFLVTPLASNNVVEGSSRSRVDGAAIVSGYRGFSDTGYRDQRWSEFVVEAGSIAKTRSEYNLSYASQFFAKQAESRELAIPRQVQDAGQLVLNAKTALELVNVMAEVGAGGRGGLVDVVAEKLAIGSTADTGDIELSAADIDKFNVNSLSLGAVRSFDPLTGHIRLDVRAKTVTVAENTEIVIPELMLAATERVELLAGSRIDTSAGSGRDQTVSTLEVTGDGALLRVSAGAQANVLRSGNAGAKGDLLMRAGAAISAGSGSVLMESSRTTKMDGELALAGGALKLVAESINLGETDDSLSGLSLDNAILSGLTAKQIVLSSRGMVNIYGELPQIGGDGLAFGFGDLVIDAHGLAGKNNAGDQVVLNADHFTLTNTHTNTAPAHGDGSGNLLINANQVVLADGKYSLSGFSDIRFNVAERVLGSGNAVLTSLANLTVDTPLMTAENGAVTSILLPGRTLVFGPGLTEAAVQGQGIAGQLWLEADNIDLNTALIYRSGRVSLNALTGDIALGEQAVVDVGGSVVEAGLSGQVAVNAGSIALNAWQGDIASHADSRLLLNAGYAKAQAGELALRAIQGVADLHGIIEAQGAEKALGGSLTVDSQTLAASGFGAWIDRFAQAGFSGGIDFRLRGGDLTVGADESIEAGRIQLAADGGAVNVAGTLDARGLQGGSIRLAAEDTIGVLDGAKLLAGALAENGAGGKVWLSSIDDRQNPDGAGIVIQSAASIDVSANGDGKAGEVVLRADRVGNDIAVADIADGLILGTDAVPLEAVRIYDYSVLNQSVLDTIQAHTQQYMDAAYPLVSARFGNGYQLLPGVEVRGSGDMTLSAQWDLSGWRYGPDTLPGVLTLRAGGDLMLNQSLSDGFVQGFIDTVDFGPIGISDMLQSGRSWSFNLIAGADIGAADNLALQIPTAISAPAAKGDLKLAAGVKLRTGTGDITARVARDIVLANTNSVIYTAGRPDDVNRWGSGGETFGVFFYAEYPLEGGDIDLWAGRNFEAKPAQQLLSEALVRTGNWSRNTDHTGERPTAWGVALGVNEANPDFVANHQQSVASFGGGNVNIKVGGNVNDLSISVSSSGKQVGTKADPNNPGSLDFTSNDLLINNGGWLQLTAGGDINGGVFYVDGNSAALTAGGSFRAGGNTLPGQQNLKPIVALGDADFNVTAGKSLALEALVDPFFATLPATPADAEGISNRFFRYGADSSVSLLALSGDISLENDSARLNAGANTQLLGDANSLAYPASLHIAALYGDLSFNKGLTLVPSALGALTMYAGGQLTGNADIHLSDADPVLLPTAVLPSSTSDELLRITNLLNPKIGGSDSHAARPLHTDDPNPVLISTGTGNIGSRDLNLAFYLNKPTEVSAGKDIVKTLFSIQHNRDGAVSVIQANRDINFPVTFNRLNGIIDEVNQGLEVAGPGQLTVLAGRDVNLGASLGVVSTGNQGNPALAEDGANISVIAGLAKGGIDAPGFAAGFVYGNPLFAGMAQRVQADAALARRFRAEMQALTGQQLDTQQALAAFESLSQARQDAISSALGLEGVTGGEQRFREQLLTEMRTITGDQNLTFDGAPAAYAGLSDAQKLRVSGKLVGAAQPMYTYIIKRAAIDLARAGVKQDQDANELKLLAAVEALFPKTTVLNGNSQYSLDPLRGVITLGGASAGSILDAGYRNGGSRPSEGDIAMFLSTIQTRDGGEVAAFAPAGGILVGLATSNIGLQKGDDQLGIIVKKQGNANLIARDDIDVNVSRVVTLGGGSILGGSTENDFDAGRAPQTALAAPPLKVSYDAIGQVVLEVAPLLAGGGARATGRGDITLFAPRGIIDAGEAGIAGNNVILAATAIMGANNISFGQSATGVPAAPTGGIAAGLAGVGNVAAAVSKAVESSTDMSKDAANSLAKAAGGMGILSVEVIGFGDDG